MGKWTDYEIQRDFTDWDDLCDTHNADCDAYENQIADLEEERDAAVEFAHTVEREFAAATATLDRLCDVVPEGRMQCLKCECNADPQYLGGGDWRCEDCERELSHFDVISAIRAILYPKETDNG